MKVSSLVLFSALALGSTALTTSNNAVDGQAPSKLGLKARIPADDAADGQAPSMTGTKANILRPSY
jgi:hypothetical protein